MEILIIKLGATGDVVRTTPLLRHYSGRVTWLTADKNKSLLENLSGIPVELHPLAWRERDQIKGRQYDLAISLEDEPETAALLDEVQPSRIFGAFRGPQGMSYTDDAQEWFDLSLISRFGRQRADELKLENRRTYQAMVFDGLGLPFRNTDTYLLPPTPSSALRGDVAIAPEAGAVWPMKRWAHYPRLQAELEARGFRVNVLPTRATLLEHLADVRGHRCVVCGDSLPMHLALGSGIPTVALFNCTSPWEIHDYGLLTKIVSPALSTYFYKRGFEEAATTAIRFDEVLEAVVRRLERPVAA